jgi:uncharacterized protein YutD
MATLRRHDYVGGDFLWLQQTLFKFHDHYPQEAVELSYLERIIEDGEVVYYKYQPEYFRLDELALANTAFEKRRDSAHPSRAIHLGSEFSQIFRHKQTGT